MNFNKDFWLPSTNKTFKNFFNDSINTQPHWSVDTASNSVKIVCGINTEQTLDAIFNPSTMLALTGKDNMNIYQYLIMVGIMLNETGGTFKLNIGEDGDLKYLYNAKPNVKSSYNCNGSSPCGSLGNKTAYELFHTPLFMNLPARANMYKPKNINDINWDGYTYPSNEPIGIFKRGSGGKLSYTPCGLIAECDFFKFRGRGVIQLTGRPNYITFLKYLKDNYTTLNLKPATQTIITSWGTDSMDNIATKITNPELDTIFEDNNAAILVFKTHRSNPILVQMYDVKSQDDFINKCYQYGKKISGGDAYANLFTNRISEILTTIPDWVAS